MPKRGSSTDPARRNFLKGATIAGAAVLATQPAAANPPIAGIPAERSKAQPPGPQLAAYLRSLPGSKPVKDFPLLSQ